MSYSGKKLKQVVSTGASNPNQDVLEFPEEFFNIGTSRSKPRLSRSNRDVWSLCLTAKSETHIGTYKREDSKNHWPKENRAKEIAKEMFVR